MHDEISLRAFQSSDNAAVIQLIADSPDTGAITFKPIYKASLSDIFSASRCEWEAVVAEHAGKIVGFAVVAFNLMQIQDETRPTAYFFSLVAHPDYRRKGVASSLAAWRLNRAREKLGKDAVIYAYIQKGNTGSIRTAQHWSNQFIGNIHTLPVKMTVNAPMPNRSITIRPAQTGEFGQLTDKLNAFYAAYNFYVRETEDTLSHWHDHTLLDCAIHAYWVAVNAQGEIVAGIGTSNQLIYSELHVDRLPTFLKVLNLGLKIIPPDGVVRNIDVEKAWYAPRQQDAARSLWNVLRYECRQMGTAFLVTYDPRSSLKAIYTRPGWSPKAQASIAAYAPFTIAPDRPIYAIL